MNKEKIKFRNFIFIFSFIFIFVSFLFLFSFSVNAAGSSAVQYPLPIVVTNENTPSFADFNYILKTNKNVDMENCADGSFGYTFTENGVFYYAFYLNEGVLDYEFSLSDDYETFDFTQDRIDFHVINIYRRFIWYYDPNGAFYGSDGWIADFHINFGQGTSNGSGGVLIPQISNKDFLYNNNEYQVVFGFGNPIPPAPEFNTGHAVEPDDLNPIDSDWSPRPQKPSFPTIINHIWNPAPTIDTTDIQSVLESIFDILQWFAQNVSDEFNNILTNIVNLIDYVGDLISYAVNAIIDTLVNIAKFLYDNFNQLFGAFFGSFLNFFEVIHDLYQHGLDENGNFSSVALGTYLFVPEVESILDIMEENDEYGFIDVINFLATTITGLGQYIHNVTPTHYINIPSFQIMGVTIPATVIDFSWYNNYKVVGDAIISAFLIIGYIYWLWTRLPGWFRGNSGDIFTENTSNSSDYHGTKIGF